MTPKASKTAKHQSEKFIAAARAAECNESEATFDDKLKRIAKAKNKSGTQKSHVTKKNP